MAKPRTPNQKKAYAALKGRLNQYSYMIQTIYDTLNAEAARLALSTGYAGEREFRWNDYPQTKKRIDVIQDRFCRDITATIYAGTEKEWIESNIVQDMLVAKSMKTYHVESKGKRYQKLYNQTNQDALKAFQERVDGGMNLSSNVWKQSTAYRRELECAISAGVEKGMSAVTLSKRLSQYLTDFDQLKADYKEKYGKAVDCLNCEYRSMRLARTEINMAYRTAEQKRWQQFDFVIGYEIKLSGSHPVEDICDSLQGRYPKDFIFMGWHPNCMCYVIPILKSEDQFWNDEKVESISEPPQNFTDYLERNAERIDKAAENGTLPYWYTDNAKYVKLSNGKIDYTKADRFFTEEEKKKWATDIDRIFKVKYDGTLAKAAEEVSKDKFGSTWNPTGERLSVDITRIHATQEGVNAKNVISLAEDISKNGITELPTAIKVGNEYYLLDGHHRVAAEIIAGKTDVDLRVVKVDIKDFVEAQGKGFDYDAYIRNLSMERKGLFVMNDNIRSEMLTRGFYDRRTISVERYNESAMSHFDILKFDKAFETICDENECMLNIKMVRSVGRGEVELVYSGTNPKGENIKLERAFRFEEQDGRQIRVVEHELFRLPEAMQGKGISKRVFRDLFTQYEACGIERVYIHANINVGGYCWAKYGCLAKDTSIKSVVEEKLAEGKITLEESKDALSFLDKFAKEGRVPMQGLANKAYGKRLLMESDWDGIIDLNDAVQMDYLYKYIGM